MNTLTLRQLLAPTASSVLENGSVVRNDKALSLWLLGQDVYGWRNWLRRNAVPFEDRADDIFYEASRKLNMSEVDAEAALSAVGAEQAIPACVFKGNMDESVDGNGDIAAWSHVLKLSPSLSTYCPPKLQVSVEQRAKEYGSKVKADTSTKPSIKRPVEARSPSTTTSHQRDKKLAQLGREIVEQLGDEQANMKTVVGRVRYRISVDLSDNTMRIYDKQRGTQPILIDADGNIDHDRSQVEPEDIQRFQALVDSIQAYQQPLQPQRQIVQMQV